MGSASSVDVLPSFRVPKLTLVLPVPYEMRTSNIQPEVLAASYRLMTSKVLRKGGVTSDSGYRTFLLGRNSSKS